MQTSVKIFIHLPPNEIKVGVIEMAKHFGISGSVLPIYDLYDAVFKEQQKAKQIVEESKHFL